MIPTTFFFLLFLSNLAVVWAATRRLWAERAALSNYGGLNGGGV